VRVLLDEHLPVDLAHELAGHDVHTVVGRGWAGIKNGDLLRRMRGDYDVLITMDRGIEFQQPIVGFPFGIVIAHAASNRLQHLRPLVPAILAASFPSPRARFSALGPNADSPASFRCPLPRLEERGSEQLPQREYVRGSSRSRRAVAAPAVASAERILATLTGYEEVPAVSTVASGEFRAMISRDKPLTTS
jgi:hypothetical protein